VTETRRHWHWVEFLLEPRAGTVHAVFRDEPLAGRGPARRAVQELLDETAAEVDWVGPYAVKWRRSTKLDALDLGPHGGRVEVFPCKGECEAAQRRVQEAHARRLADRLGVTALTAVPEAWPDVEP
jgi:hypothetical protein